MSQETNLLRATFLDYAKQITELQKQLAKANDTLAAERRLYDRLHICPHHFESAQGKRCVACHAEEAERDRLQADAERPHYPDVVAWGKTFNEQSARPVHRAEWVCTCGVRMGGESSTCGACGALRKFSKPQSAQKQAEKPPEK